MFYLLFMALFSFNIFAANVPTQDITLTSNNTVSLFGPVTDQSVGQAMRDLQRVSELGEESEPIYLFLNTPGGSVFAGLDLIQYMKTLRRPVHSIAHFAASMGFHILQNSKVRYVTEYGRIMSHRASGGFEGDIPHQINSRFNGIMQVLNKMDEQVVSRTNGKYTKESYMELIRDEYWATGSHAIDDKFADEVANVKCDESLNGYDERTIKVFIFSVNLKVARCPLITEPLVEPADKRNEVINYLTLQRKLEF